MRRYKTHKISLSSVTSRRYRALSRRDINSDQNMNATENMIIVFLSIARQIVVPPSTASPETLHNSVWRTWLFTAYSDER